MVIHILTAEANLREGIDEPCPFLIIADPPLQIFEYLYGDKAVDYKIAEMYNSVGHVFVYHFA